MRGGDMNSIKTKDVIINGMMLAILVFAGCRLLNPSAAGVSVVQPADLRCEYRENPLGIDVVKPRLGWKIEAKDEGSPDLPESRERPERGIRQAAYQVLVASSEELLKKDKGDLWDSGKLESDQSIQVEYAGKPLESGQYCYWKLRIWTNLKAKPSRWSEPASWVMGLLKPEDWQAKWIKCPADETSPWMRKEFKLDAVPEKATAFVNIHGYYELYINGKKVGDDVLSPAVSDLPKRSLYRVHDIGRFLRAGDNCVGLWLGKGWARSGIMARVQLAISTNGKVAVVGTDCTWTCSPSAPATCS